MLSAELDNEEDTHTAKEKKIKLTCIMKILLNYIVYHNYMDGLQTDLPITYSNSCGRLIMICIIVKSGLLDEVNDNDKDAIADSCAE